MDRSENQRLSLLRTSWLNLVLFLLTLASTTFFGFSMGNAWAEGLSDPDFVWYTSSAVWIEGLSYSLSMMSILLAHEMGHYLTARRHGVDASLPYFIPFPTVFGTLGAFIRLRLREQVPADSLLRIGANGPLAGFLVAVPVLIVGLFLSDVRPMPEDLESGILLGDSLIMLILERVIFGAIPEGMDIWLHPMAFAGWAGILITAFNLLPLSQLDGGHIAYCLFGEKFNRMTPYLFIALLLLAATLFPGWISLCVLLLFLGLTHPPICADAPVKGAGRWIGWMTVGVFVLTFIPVPFHGMLPTLLDLLGW